MRNIHFLFCRGCAEAGRVLKQALLVFPLILCYFVNVRIFKHKWFNRFTKKEGIADSELREIVKQLENGQFYADLGGGLYKMEMSRKGKGKHGGYRTLVVFKSEFRTFFLYGFPKSKVSNIEEDALKGYKKQAKENLLLTEEQINLMLKVKDLIEVLQEEKNEI